LPIAIVPHFKARENISSEDRNYYSTKVVNKNWHCWWCLLKLPENFTVAIVAIARRDHQQYEISVGVVVFPIVVEHLSWQLLLENQQKHFDHHMR